MSSIDKNSINLTDEQRYDLFMQQLMMNKSAWILVDEYGAVMLKSEDSEEDYVPFWPSEELAADWATEDWKHCEPKQLSFDDIQEKWLPGMEEDDLLLLIFPALDLQGRIFYPWEFGDVLTKKLAKLARKN